MRLGSGEVNRRQAPANKYWVSHMCVTEIERHRHFMTTKFVKHKPLSWSVISNQISSSETVQSVKLHVLERKNIFFRIKTFLNFLQQEKHKRKSVICPGKKFFIPWLNYHLTFNALKNSGSIEWSFFISQFYIKILPKLRKSST